MLVYALKTVLDMALYFLTNSGVITGKCSVNLSKGITFSQSFLIYKIGHCHLTVYEPCRSRSQKRTRRVYFNLANFPLGCAFYLTEGILILHVYWV